AIDLGEGPRPTPRLGAMRRSSHRAEVEQDGEMMLVIDSDALATLARRHHVSRLSLFGSAATESFDPERSDADFLVEFSPESPSPFEDYFRLKEALEAMFGRPVDLVTSSSLENPHFAASVARTAV